MDDLKKNGELMNAIEDMGFGSLLKHLHPVKLEHQYIIELVNSFDVQSCSVRGLAVTDGDVGDILGVKSSGKLIPDISGDQLAEFKNKYKKKNICKLTDALKKFKNADLNFREIFFLCAFANFYCPISKDVPCEKLYKALSVLSSPQEYNWGNFILDFLLEEIKNYKIRAEGKEESSLRNLGLGGCIYFLQVFYLQKSSPLTVERGKPLMSAWTIKETKIAVKGTEKAKGLKKIVNNDDKGNKEQFVEGLPGCMSLEQRLARLEQFEQRIARLEGIVLQLPSSSTAGINERMPRIEEILSTPGKTVFREGRSTDEPMIKSVKNSFEADALVSTDVFFLYVRYLNRTRSVLGAAKILLEDAYTYQWMEGEYKRLEPEATLANKLKFNEYSYLLIPVCIDFHYSLVIVCFGDEEANSSPIVLHLDSLSYHLSTWVFKIIEWFLEKLWTNTKGSNSNMPNVIKHQVKVPQQTNSYDCAFFVMHMMNLFCEQAPMRFQMENLEMFSNWFDPKDASALRKDMRHLMHEELEGYLEKPISWNNDIYESPHLQQTDDITDLDDNLMVKFVKAGKRKRKQKRKQKQKAVQQNPHYNDKPPASAELTGASSAKSPHSPSGVETSRNSFGSPSKQLRSQIDAGPHASPSKQLPLQIDAGPHATLDPVAEIAEPASNELMCNATHGSPSKQLPSQIDAGPHATLDPVAEIAEPASNELMCNAIHGSPSKQLPSHIDAGPHATLDPVAEIAETALNELMCNATLALSNKSNVEPTLAERWDCMKSQNLRAPKKDDENVPVSELLQKRKRDADAEPTLEFYRRRNCLRSQKLRAPCSKQPTKKTLVLDVNGLLADIIFAGKLKGLRTWSSTPYKIINDKYAVFKRPHIDDFLKFCFERFNVGVWSSRSKENLDPVLDYVFRNAYKSKLAFQWNQKHCTNTGQTVPGDNQKPMFLKEISKIWKDPVVRKVVGVLDESNTLLLDDSPYKAKENPPNTSIFPDTYKYNSLDDNLLGDGGDLRKYLERLSSAPNVQKFVEQNMLFSAVPVS